MSEDASLERIKDVLNNPDLRIAFRDSVELHDAKVYTELAMAQPFPVLVLNTSLRDEWLADPGRFMEYLGELPDLPETGTHDVSEVFPKPE